jgi:hypothetical protein
LFRRIALRIAAQRAAGEAFLATVNKQLNRSALRPGLLAAKAALVAPMQNVSRVAAVISMVRLMPRSSNFVQAAVFARRSSSNEHGSQADEFGPVLA